MDGNNAVFLEPATYIQSDAPEIIAYAAKITTGLTSDKDKAIALFNEVRDKIRYDPYTISLSHSDYKATAIINTTANWCVPKAILLTALTRAAQIPAAVGFADVRNHLSTPKLLSLMESDLFTYHGYTAFWLNGAWVKATPAFNMDMCTRFGVHPLVFNGETETLFHEYNTSNQRHMEYVNDRGMFIDAPVDDILLDLKTRYPKFATAIKNGKLGELLIDPKFRP